MPLVKGYSFEDFKTGNYKFKINGVVSVNYITYKNKLCIKSWRIWRRSSIVLNGGPFRGKFKIRPAI